MLKKTLEKIINRFESLPKHHIDTSIFFRSRDKEESRQCMQYLARINRKYAGVISLPVLAEIFMTVNEIENYGSKLAVFDFIDETIKTRNIKKFIPKNLTENIGKIREIDKQIDILDEQILACAIENNANVLVTIDKSLLNNYKIQDVFKIKIKHPKELL